MIENVDLKESTIGSQSFLEDLYPLEWHMTRNERYCLVTLLERLRPKVSIEIGTNKGGSLQVLSKFSEKTYSIDINPDVEKELGEKFDNVEFLTGDSTNILPTLFLRDEVKENIEFVLIDGDHTFNGVKNDIDCVLEVIPKKPLFIIFHDSFNPICRSGIKAARFQECPYLHYVELDYINGVYAPNELSREMWGGLALALMLPEKRNGMVEINESQKDLYELSFLRSKHRWENRFGRLRKIIKKISKH